MHLIHCIIAWLAEEIAALKTQPNWLNQYKLDDKLLNIVNLPFLSTSCGLTASLLLMTFVTSVAGQPMSKETTVYVYLPPFFCQYRSVTLSLPVGASVSLRE